MPFALPPSPRADASEAEAERLSPGYLTAVVTMIQTVIFSRPKGDIGAIAIL